MEFYTLEPKIHSEAVADYRIINQIPIQCIVVLSLIFYLFSFSGCLSSDAPYGGEEFTVGDGNFTVVVLPDTQDYSESYPETYYAQADWIVRNASSGNIKFVIHLGDFVNNSTSDQWEVVDVAHDILDKNFIPYCVTLGNHDYETDGDPERDSTKFNQYLGTDRFSGKSWYGGGYPSGKNDNSYYFFEAEDLDFLVISLEYAPRKDTLAWAADIINSYPYHRVIIVTHGYLYTSGYSLKHAGLTRAYDSIGSDGTTLFNEFISRYSNIFMVIAGHCEGDGVRPIEANDGHIIYEVLVDYQFEPNGGNGWFKTLVFSPSEDRILIASHTVSRNVSTFSQTESYSSDPEDHIYGLSYDMSTMPDFAETVNPVGFNDRLVNSEDSGNCIAPKVVNTLSGYSLVAWGDDSDHDGSFDIKIRGFTPDGLESFGEKTVNNNKNGTCLNLSVADDSRGNVVVVWQDDSDGDGYYDIKMSGYTIIGTCRFSNYTVNSDFDGQQINPAVAMDSTGKFVVVWQEDKDDTGNYEIYMSAFDPTGVQYFDQRMVNSTSDGQQINPDIEVLSNGNFIVVWQDDRNGNGYSIYMRGFEFSPSATEFLSEREITTDSDSQQFNPAICNLPNGRFVITWEDDNYSTRRYEIYMSGFDSNGVQYFNQKVANSDIGARQFHPAIASDRDGYFTVTWQDGLYGANHIMIKGFNQAANEIMPEIRVNKDESGQQMTPDVMTSEEGRFLVVWMDDTDGDGNNKIVARGAYDFGFESYYGE